jgi:zinc transport system substrate-binding protein
MITPLLTIFLSALPQQQAILKQNAQQFIHDLEQLDKRIRDDLQHIKKREFLVFHPSWGYFAQAYQFKQIAIEHEGKEPSSKRLTQIIRYAKKKRIKVILLQQQFSPRTVKMIAKAIDAKIVRLDPLAENYLDNIEKISQLLAKTLE